MICDSVQRDARKAAIESVGTIDGWLTPREAAALYDLAAKSRGPIVEIGSHKGRSTAALALGSMAGNQQPITAIDNFVGDVGDDGLIVSTPEILRSNLDRVGVNGLVRIVPQSSTDAVADIAECDLLFIDGAHDLNSVSHDLDLYLPKILDGGIVVLHDCDDIHEGVVLAAENYLMSRPNEWRATKRVDTSMIFERRASLRHKVRIGFPGKSLIWGAAKGLLTASLGANDVTVSQSGNGWDDMEILWVDALNSASRGEITHFAMLHSDVVPSLGWLDVLANELDDRDADMISVIQAIKDDRGVTSCGIGDPSNPWQAFRRFTVRELADLPETFAIEDTPHPDKYLLHNTGCLIIDLRKRLWRKTDDNGCLKAIFNFPLQAKLQADGTFEHQRESEDWYFSRQIASLGAKTYATRKVQTHHVGDTGYPNTTDWGRWEHDEHTRHKWGGECQR